ncbi:MAG: TFIIB-type zinc ribbon-containing protein [Defluviitaleaceae bacterium]|nr:TFIIB-type zinc ribbon-containing protein [Defluviitaleaceae bacterium]
MISGDTEVKIVQTNEGAKDGQNKCPKCGATDIAFSIGAGMLRCNFCRHEFEAERAVGLDTDLSKLEGKVVGSGALNIEADASDIVTLKCTSCDAEVVIDTNESMGARCHWCRNTLSIAQQIPNGSVPDMVLPFSIAKNDAQEQIAHFVKKRQFFALPKFKEEFCTENIMGVYLPYMVVGINSHASFTGKGERETRRYTVGSDKNRRTVYDADVCEVNREFDLIIDGLTIVSNAAKLDSSAARTNNIVNAIKPFDHENCVKWDANYLKGFASEKRDTNIEDLTGSVVTKAEDIARHNASGTIKQYDRGVKWDKEELKIKGKQWKAAYMPIWLYSYQQKKNDSAGLLHYIAVNARNKKVMGSVPIHQAKLLLFSLIAQAIGTVIGVMLMLSMLASLHPDDEIIAFIPLVLLASGFAFYGYFYKKYRNTSARFSHETDTKTTVCNMESKDEICDRLVGVSHSKMRGANHLDVRYKL